MFFPKRYAKLIGKSRLEAHFSIIKKPTSVENTVLELCNNKRRKIDHNPDYMLHHFFRFTFLISQQNYKLLHFWKNDFGKMILENGSILEKRYFFGKNMKVSLFWIAPVFHPFKI